MLCICGSTLCECEGQCLCCPLTCLCEKCFKIRCLYGAHCRHCGGFVTPYVCSMMPVWRRSGLYPNMDFTRPHTQQTNRGSDERANPETSAPGGAQSSTGSRKSPKGAQGSTASRRSVLEDSRSPSRGSPSSDDSLQFQMDDINFSPEASTNTSTGGKCRAFQGSPHSSSKIASEASPEQRESPSKIRKRLFPNYVKVTFKAREDTECKTPALTPPQQPDETASGSRETRREGPIASNDVAECSRPNPASGTSQIEDSRLTGDSLSGSATDSNRAEFEKASTTMQDAPGCSFCNPKSISKVESKVDDKSPKHKVDGTGLEKTGLLESEIINKDIPGYSDRYKHVPKREDSSITDNASHAIQPSDEYASSDSLLSNLHLDDAQSSILVSPRSSIRQLSTSVPSVYDCPKPTELKSLEQKQSTSLGTSAQSSPSKLDALSISNIRSIDKSRSELSSSVDDIPEHLHNGARYGVLHGESSIPSDFSESSQLNNSELKAESKKPGGTSQALQNSKLPSTKESKSAGQRTSSESDSLIETIPVEQNDSSEDEASTNKSPKKND